MYCQYCLSRKRYLERILPSNNEVRDGHSDAANNKNCLTAKFVNVENGRNGGQEHDDAHYTSRKQGKSSTSDSNTLEDEWCYRSVSSVSQAL